MSNPPDSPWPQEDANSEDGLARPAVAAQACNAPEDRWWHYLGALVAILAIGALGLFGLRSVEPDCGGECSSIRQDVE